MLHLLALAVPFLILLGMAMVRPMVGVIAFDWISLMNPQQDLFGTGAHLPWALGAALATVIGCLVAHEPRRFPMTSTQVLIVAFAGLITFNTLFALVPASVESHDYIQLIKSLGFAMLVGALVTSHRRLHAVLWIMVISIGYYGVRGGGFALLTGGKDHVYGPANTFIGDNNQLAVALLMTIPLMNYLRLHAAHRAVRTGLLASMVLTLFAVVATYSRGGLIALAAMVARLWWNSRNRLTSFLLFGIVMATAISFMPADWKARMFTILHFHHSNSANERMTVWRDAFGIALHNPLTGGGFQATAMPGVIHRYFPMAQQRATHSIWFEVLGDQGFPALFVWIALNLNGLFMARRVARRARGNPALAWLVDFGRMTEVSIIAFMVGGSFLSLGYYDYFYMLLILVSSALVLLRAELPRVAAEAAPAAARGWRARGAVAQ
ncbi:putative O-glycosylation ligase, exosortase A system-associated [Acidiphilium sp.]|uniref:putative O-glycosylation ligase, exosortase A system-associated n=1 Tax=Acidiphilium sp. TaxID=527 RepID=UPI0025909599|nr:putative O-glycosylation ligase, exosortase A system-associated [Acidiphilium sp.]